MPVSVEKPVAKALSLTQRSTQALAQLAERVGRSDTKVLAAALAEAAVDEADRNHNFVRSVQMLYDALATSAKRPRPKPPATPRKDLIPIVPAGEVVIGRYDKPDAYVLQRLYGNDQLRDALDGYPLASLKEMAEVVMERNPNTQPTTKRTKAAVIDYIVSRLTGGK